MKEVTFLQQNASRWRHYEGILNNVEFLTAPRLAELFSELSEDLSFSRSFYPDSNTTAYLNYLTYRVMRELGRPRRTTGQQLRTFWGRKLPQLYWQARHAVLFSFIIFFASAALGWISASYDDGFVRLILGDSYVNMTISNIEKNDPMAVYKQMHEVPMSFGITLNNIRVALTTFALGIFFAFGTIWSLFNNGVMLGAFQQFFAQHDLLRESLLTVYIHGTPEISAIVLAGGAGLTLGLGLLAPGTYPRLSVFRRVAKRGLLMALGLIPLFIYAGLLEGFVTRHTEIPDAGRLAIILFSALLLVFYFVVIPLRQNDKEPRHDQ
jgi:uncharacterized membrane protein SpoIIM required for sporulation